MKIPAMLKPEREDFMPILVGGAMLIMATSGFLMVFFLPDPGSGGFATVVLVLLGVLGAIGAALYALDHARAGTRRAAPEEVAP